METIGKVNILPVDYNVEWVIPNFLLLPMEDDKYYNSHTFSFNGASWCLRIYPNGEKEDHSVGFIDILLEKKTGPEINLNFSLSLKNSKGMKELETLYTDTFESETRFGSSCFISRSEIVRRKSKLLPANALTVVCTLQYPETRKCSSCGKNADAKDISPNEKCMDKQTKCSEVSLLQNRKEQGCPDVGSEECSPCGKNANAKDISVHEKCMDKQTKCSECSEVSVLQNRKEHGCLDVGSENETSLCDDFKEMLLNGLNHDLILKVGDKEIRSHQDVLRARSQVFKSMLTHDMKEKNSGIIDIPDCDPQAMEQFLCYIYTGKIDSPDQCNMLKLYYIADKYDMKGLKGICCAFIKKSLSTTNISEVIQLSLNHSDSGLLEHATEYFMDNAVDIMYTVEWQSFMKDNSTVANELTIKAFKKLKNINA